MKVKENKFRVKLKLYRINLQVVLSENVPLTADKVPGNWQRDNNPDDDPEYEAIFFYDEPDTRDYMIVFPYACTPGTIAHEVVHMKNKLFKTLQLDQDPSDGHETYFMQFFIDEIWEKIEKIRSKRKEVKVEGLVESDDNNKDK